MKKINLLLWLMLLCSSGAYAKNIIFNSSFELGDSGYVCEKYLRTKTNPTLIYTAPRVDTKTFTNGKQSLLLPNSFAETFDLQSREFKIVPGKAYTFSIDMKSSVDNYPVTISFVTVRKYRRRTVKQQKQFIVGKEWKRYVFKFTAYNKKELVHYYLRLDNGKMLSKNNPDKQEPLAADLWLDSLRLIQGNAKAYAPSRNVEIAVVPKRRTVLKGAKIMNEEINILLNNSTTKRVKAKLNFNVIDGYSSKQLAKSTKSIVIPAGKTIETMIPVRLEKYGSYRLKADLADSIPFRTLSANIALIGKVGKLPDNYNYDFSVGVDGNLGWRRYAMKSGKVNTFKPGYRAVGYSPMKGMEYTSLMGCRIIRAHNLRGAFDWSTVEPQEGKFDFQHTDLLVNTALRNNIKIVPCIGTMEFMPRKWGGGKVAALPKWLQEKSKKSSYAPMLRKYRQKFIYLPPVELWKRYIRVLAERYKGKITNWEIMNEPNLFIIPEDYLIYLKAAYSVLKNVDKSNKIVGFCATGDLGGSVNSFLGKAFSLGGLKYTNAVAFHPYHARTLASAKPADKMISDVKALFRRYSKKEIALWNTELYFLKDNDDSGYYAAEYLAHRFLTDLGEGVKQSISVQKNIMLRPVQNYYQSLASSYVQFPDSNFVVYNTMARLFMGAKPAGKTKLAYDSICYIYEKNGEYLAAFWHYGNINGLKMALNINSSEGTLYDLLGNKVAMNDQLEFSRKPYYLSWKGKDKNSFINKLKNIKITGDILLKLGGFRVLMTDQGWQAALGIENLSADTVAGEVSLSARGLEFPKASKFVLAGGTSQAITIPVKITGNLPDKVTAELSCNGKSFTLTTDKCFPSPILYTVKKSNGKFLKLKNELMPGTAKHKAAFALRYDEKYMYIDVKVEDQTPSGKANNRSPWQQDCVELMIDTKPLSNMIKNPEAHYRQLPRFFILPYTKRKVDIWRRGLKKLQVKSEIKITKEGYTATLKIPFEKMGISLPVEGKCIGFEILVDNANGASADAVQLRWNSTGKAHKNRGQFGLVYFK